MTKSFSLPLVVASACLAGVAGCKPAPVEDKAAPRSEATATEDAKTETPPSDEAKPADATTGAVEAGSDAAEESATKTSGAQKRTPTGKVNVNAAAGRPAGDVARRAAAAPTSASGPSHAVRPAQPTASAAGARTASAVTAGAMAKPTAVASATGNDVEVRSERVSRAAPAPSADGRIDNAARMLQLEAGEGDSAG